MEAWVIRDPEVMLGKPVVAGTRITVEEILRRLAAGETPEEVLAAHPRLTPEGLRAALLYAAETLGAEVYYPVPDKVA
ncbi:DUF433 domain-containing protein [Thermus scotoductus]|jgi:uncharacterized protein (DUF433 family)|uniref:DUF433 domain-containing protein n=2 Tax=Thermus scotoductus TaxID=37636 RepID=A0A430QZ56_THESC|nr:MULTISPECIES: DUF433 domain-containing protein [Thermus]ADW22608.1 conserved domain protein [Thermus scotoductus SA-01]QWK22200.1 MAG: DUF433 domain-containing protein [Thermus antranikianii]RTG95582.1 DUF433 domain-containing protein [Thermus scotoductus]RTG99202.1 DUF433 domain-containing protein [Thermus scotoductus]RTH00395.1 DUF433 domain-containing protein [Thermus scotoductus]